LVTRGLFIVALAIATAAAGIALLVMLARRRRRDKQLRRWAALGPPPMPAVTRRAPPPLVRARAAAPASYGDALGQTPVASAAPLEEEAPYIEEEAEEATPFGAPGPGDIGMICPSCGSRYGSQYRVCERDNMDLAAVH
jgi:hypothetical protein